LDTKLRKGRELMDILFPSKFLTPKQYRKGNIKFENVITIDGFLTVLVIPSERREPITFPYFWTQDGTSDELKLRPQKLKKEDTYRIQNKVYFSRVSMSNNEEKKTTQHGFTFRNFTSRT
jgi:hypothetical protein